MAWTPGLPQLKVGRADSGVLFLRQLQLQLLMVVTRLIKTVMAALQCAKSATLLCSQALQHATCIRICCLWP